MVRLDNENQLSSLPGSALKVCVVVGGWFRVNSVIVFGLALALAKPNNCQVKYCPLQCKLECKMGQCTHLCSDRNSEYFPIIFTLGLTFA